MMNTRKNSYKNLLRIMPTYKNLIKPIITTDIRIMSESLEGLNIKFGRVSVRKKHPK
jgi:hypothetical protein